MGGILLLVIPSPLLHRRRRLQRPAVTRPPASSRLPQRRRHPSSRSTSHPKSSLFPKRHSQASSFLFFLLHENVHTAPTLITRSHTNTHTHTTQTFRLDLTSERSEKTTSPEKHQQDEGRHDATGGVEGQAKGKKKKRANSCESLCLQEQERRGLMSRAVIVSSNITHTGHTKTHTHTHKHNGIPREFRQQMNRWPK